MVCIEGVRDKIQELLLFPRVLALNLTLVNIVQHIHDLGQLRIHRALPI
jgi:hypothetical protein